MPQQNKQHCETPKRYVKNQTAGYAVTSPFTMNFFWCSILLNFILKWIITKHGGIGGFRKTAPFFLGLVLGEFVVTTFWGTSAILLRLETYITINL